MTSAHLKIQDWKRNPVRFVEDNFKVALDQWQLDALVDLGGDTNPRRRLTMRACTGPGKSAVLAWIGWHRLTCFAEKGEHPKGAALSGEGRDNLRDNLWAELSKWQQRSKFLMAAFTWNKEQIFANDHPQTWFLSARSYAKDADNDAIGRSLSGLHSKFPFVLLDEIGAMPITVGQKASQIFTGGVVDGLIASAGNPVTTSGLLYHICTNERATNTIVTITADPDDPNRTPRVDADYAREQIKTHGRDNPWIKATILGEFPPGDFNSLISLEDVEAAMRKHLREDQYAFSQKRLGIDPARFGDDRTCIFPRQGLASFKPVVMRGARSNEIAARVATAKEKWGSELEFVDGTGGFGSGVIDSLMQAGHTPHEIHFSGKATDVRYFNKRSEMWFLMAEWIKRGAALPNDPELARELTVPTYAFINGKFQLEPKDQIKARLGFSPDLADALALTFALPDRAAALPYPFNMKQEHHKVKSEWDPFK